jgi:hypothetical protein
MLSVIPLSFAAAYRDSYSFDIATKVTGTKVHKLANKTTTSFIQKEIHTGIVDLSLPKNLTIK